MGQKAGQLSHLEAVHLQAPLVIDVHVLLLGRREELLIVQECGVPHRFSDLHHRTITSPCSPSPHSKCGSLAEHAGSAGEAHSIDIVNSEKRVHAQVKAWAG